jgi:uncharacterized membrane protein YeaQ/YmgE (transglycosylase-associated protein family)
MEILWFIAIGMLAGFLAGLVIKGKGSGYIVNLLVGVVGAILGGFLFEKLGIDIGGNDLIGALIIAFSGSVVLLFVLKLIRG